MRKNDNGIYREMTPEEVKALQDEKSMIPPPTPDPTEVKLAQMQAQIDALLEGRTQA